MAHGPAQRIVLARLPSPLGPLLMAHAGDALLALEFEDEGQRLLSHLRRRYPGCNVADDEPHAHTRRCVEAYFGGDTSALDAVTVRVSGTLFQRRVWTALRTIGPGHTTSYTALARRIGAPRAVRAVGRANALNPASLVVPCHRVIGADGNLTGYAGGIERKRWLLRHEGAIA